MGKSRERVTMFRLSLLRRAMAPSLKSQNSIVQTIKTNRLNFYLLCIKQSNQMHRWS